MPRKEIAEWTKSPKTTKNDKQQILTFKLISMYVNADRPLECEFIHVFYRLRNGSLTEMRMFFFQHNIFQCFS